MLINVFCIWHHNLSYYYFMYNTPSVQSIYTRRRHSNEISYILLSFYYLYIYQVSRHALEAVHKRQSLRRCLATCSQGNLIWRDKYKVQKNLNLLQGRTRTTGHPTYRICLKLTFHKQD